MNRVALWSIFGLLGVLVSCSGKTPDSLEPTVLALQKTTCPESGNVSAYDGIKRDAQRVEASWVLETAQDWEAYRRWVAGRLAGYERTASSAGESTFIRALTGDVHSLRIERIQPGPPLRVRITFLAHPS